MSGRRVGLGAPFGVRYLVFLAWLLPVKGAAETPRIVLQITVDQLRGDMLPRLRDRFGEGGFRRLLDTGTYFANAYYDTSNTITASGHAVLVTGAVTAGHGMVGNEWFDRDLGRIVYCTADPHHPVLGEPPKSDAGASPANLTSSTIGDEIVAGSAGRSRAFAVAGKDRSAIIPGGHRGKAFWFSEVTGGFVSSTYYFDALPGWMRAWNETKPIERYRTLEWQPLRALDTYRGVAGVANLHARPNATLGRVFPHPLLARSDALFFSALHCTPFLDELTATFARELITGERIGQAEGVDYLSISFSGVDYIGHAYGPNSVEYEDSLLRLDATLADLFRFLDRTVGLNRVLVVLASDHGVGDIPEAARAAGIDAQRIQPQKMKERLNGALRDRFSIKEDLVAAFVPPGLYLDQKRIAEAKLDVAVVETALAQAARALPGVAQAFTRTELLSDRTVPTAMLEKVRHGFHPQRSGDVVIVQQKFWYMYPDAEAYAAMHGSPYSYDTFVPIVFCGPGIEAGTCHDHVSPAQIAPTLAALLGVNAPSSCATTTVLPGILSSPGVSGSGAVR